LTASRQNEWDNSFKNHDNYLFYPHEEVIRFISKYVVKRVGFDEFQQIMTAPRMLDLGCGIGRHVVYGHENNIDSYGIDISEEGIAYGRKFAASRGIPAVEDHLKVGDVRNLPWDDGFFNIVVSHGVLDSMSFDIARDGVRDLHRATSGGALFYCDLICHPDDGVDKEEVVETSHEKGTIQSYFTDDKVDELFEGYFTLVEKIKIVRNSLTANVATARWHLILERK